MQQAATIYLKYTNTVHKNWQVRPSVLIAFWYSVCYDIQYKSAAIFLRGGIVRHPWLGT